MKKSIGIVVLIAVAVGYLLGTEHGRAQREVILVKLGRGGNDPDPIAAAADAVADATA